MVREKSGKFKVREKIGTFVLGQGILKKVREIWENPQNKKSGKIDFLESHT